MLQVELSEKSNHGEKIIVKVVQCQLISLNKWRSSQRNFGKEQLTVATNERRGLRLRENPGNDPLSRIGEFGAAQIAGTISQKPLSRKSGESAL